MVDLTNIISVNGGLTKLEKSVLKAIATSEFNQLNGGIPKTVEESATYLYVDEIADDTDLTMNQVKGVISSLVKKNMIEVDDDWGSNDSLVQITEEGIDELN